MGSKAGNYLRAPGRSTAPGAIVSVVVKKWLDRELDGGPGTAVATLAGVCVSATRRVRGQWSRITEHEFETAGEFWRWIEQWAESGRKTYVVSPLASDALVHLQFFPEVDRRGAKWDKRLHSKGAAIKGTNVKAEYTFRRLVLKGAPDIVDYTVAGRSFCWLSVRNYFHFDYKDIPRVSVPSDGVSADGDTPSLFQGRDQWQAESYAWVGAMTDLADWWIGLDCGSWASTAGAMGERFLRSRMAPKSVVTHRCEHTQRLERLAAHRGRVSNWYVGATVAPDHTDEDTQGIPQGPGVPIGSEIIHIDVRSMYPWLLSTTDLPCQRMKYIDNPSVDTARQLCNLWVCTASVRLDTQSPEYPHRTTNGVSYPIGRFTAYLSGLELKRALDDECVTACHGIAVYRPGRPFAPAAEELMRLRSKCRAEGNKGWELFVKLMSNSLTGKLAQKKTRWIEKPNHLPIMRWGTWPELNMDTGDRRTFRALAGLVWEQIREESGVGLLTACYGHLTAACSHRMRTIREILPARSVLSQDTDGIWCLPECETILRGAGLPFGDDPGNLRVTARSRWSRFWGPKHYFANGHWRLSGLGKPVPRSDGLSFLDQRNFNAIRGTPLAPPTNTVDVLRATTLSTLGSDGTVGPDGWVLPRGSVLPTGIPSPSEEVEDCKRECQKNNTKSLFD